MLIVFDDFILDMESNKHVTAIVTELFLYHNLILKCQKL